MADLWAVEALIEHLILTNYQNTNLSESKVLKLSGCHGVVPLCLPVRSADIGDGQDLVVDRHDHYHEISYAPAADRPTLDHRLRLGVPDTQDLIHEINDLQSTLRDRFVGDGGLFRRLLFPSHTLEQRVQGERARTQDRDQ